MLVFAVVFGINLLPAFAPPTWSVLVFFALNQNLNEISLITLGIVSATSARLILAVTFRKNQHRFPRSYISNLENAATHLSRSKGHIAAIWLLFFVSPFSSAQLFEAAGLMKSVALRPLVVAFASGRVVTYSLYVFGTSAFAATSLGQLIKENITSPVAIAVQVLFIAALVGLGMIKWRPYRENSATS
ncbi:MAG: hypothetical protein EBS36_04330 [Actinobacteria bacterium]|nr:hypothetical protein [Actinomycetota bacterium]NBY15469.1 hypothetical protein [Actinomycetota bacterium]